MLGPVLLAMSLAEPAVAAAPAARIPEQELATYQDPAPPLRPGQPEAALPDLVPGDRVRVLATSLGEKPVVAQVREAGATELVLAFPDGRLAHVDRRSIARLEVSVAKQDRTRPGALAGATLGVPLAVLTVFAVGHGSGNSDGYGASAEGLVAAGILSVAVAAGIGALIGHQHETDVWGTLPATGVRLHVTPTRGRGLRASVAFTF